MTTRQTPADQAAAHSEPAAAQPPPEILTVFATEQAQLDNAGVPAAAAKPGGAMPDSELLDIEGNATSITELRAGRAAVIVFYRGAWCPYCNLALRTYQAQLVGPLTEKAVALIAISPQKPDGSLSMKDKNQLGYAVVSDSGNHIATRLGILTAPSPEAAAAQRGLGLNLAEINADGTTSLPMPTVVIVDEAGILRWIDVHPNYTTRSEPDQILAALADVLSS